MIGTSPTQVTRQTTKSSTPICFTAWKALEPGSALDIGCGAGGHIVALAQLGWKVTGINIAEKANRIGSCGRSAARHNR